MNWLGRRRCGTVRGVALGALVWPLVAQDVLVIPPAGQPTVAESAGEAPSDTPPAVPVKPPAGKSEYARKISVRNAFALQDPVPVTPPTPPPAPPPPPVPKSAVQLTGFSRWGGERKVYLVVTKPGAKGPDYFDLREGDERADIKVLQIDERNETVQIVNTGVEETLNFKDNGAKAAAGSVPVPNVAGVQPGAIVGQGVPPPPNMNANNRFGGSGPTVVGRGGVVESNPGNPGGNAGAQQVFPNNTVPHIQVGGGSEIPATLPVISGQNGQNPTLNRSRIFNIPPPPLPPVQ